ncbi:MAG: hypothetical protein ACI9OJ_000666 [Myxococcota bacterium]|jgi:hypothetical protein
MANQLSPDEFKHLKAFKALLESTLADLRDASSQSTLAAAVETWHPKWEAVHPEFADVLGGIKSQVWHMPYPQVKPVAQAVVAHLDMTLADVKKQLG